MRCRECLRYAKSDRNASLAESEYFLLLKRGDRD